MFKVLSNNGRSTYLVPRSYLAEMCYRSNTGPWCTQAERAVICCVLNTDWGRRTPKGPERVPEVGRKPYPLILIPHIASFSSLSSIVFTLEHYDMQMDFKYLRTLDFPELQYHDVGRVNKGNNKQ